MRATFFPQMGFGSDLEDRIQYARNRPFFCSRPGPQHPLVTVFSISLCQGDGAFFLRNVLGHCIEGDV